MKYCHVGAVVLVAALVGFVGCRKDRDRAGVTYYPSPAVAAPSSPAAMPAPPSPPSEAAHAPPPPQAAPLAPGAESAAPEVLTQGPLHEAFAEVINYNPQPGMVAPRAPPAPIEEMPPDERPAGTVWISGYWAWDDQRQDFLWVSGIWRIPPPGVSWVPGYWTQTAEGWQWTSGFWKSNAVQEITYLPPPPASLELGPSSPPPSEDHIWVTGCWTWGSARYLWRPGYWMVARPSWVWVPSYCLWTPRGYVFVDGYWDYMMERRGMVFAPVYFPSAAMYVGHAGMYYSPTVVIDTDWLTLNLFTRPRYCHYYFGDYYAAQYDQLGIYPWFSVFEHGRYAYDPIFSHYGWYFRSRDPKWIDNLRSWHAFYRAHADRRPPHDLTEQERVMASAEGRRDRQFLTIALPVAQWRNNPNAPVRITAVSSAEKARIEKTMGQVQEFRTQRAELEARTAGGISAERGGPPGTAGATPYSGPQRLRLPSLPTIGSPVGIAPRVATRPGPAGPETLGPTTDQNGRPPRPRAEIPGAAPAPNASRTPGAMPLIESNRPAQPERPQPEQTVAPERNGAGHSRQPTSVLARSSPF